MDRFLRPLVRGATYTRLVYLWVPMFVVSVWALIDDTRMWVPAALLIPAGLVPAVRTGEGLQARWLLAPGQENEAFSTAPARNWRDRLRTVVWLQARLLLGLLTAGACVWLPILAVELAGLSAGYRVDGIPVLRDAAPHWAFALLAPLPVIALYGAVVGLGAVATAGARALLGPSAAERFSALEERTEQLLERNRIARELHDSIGHALTVAVVQAGAARAAKDAEFTERALAAIEETGRDALEDLERVLGVLREARTPVGARPTLADAGRLLESARVSGAEVDAELMGPLEALPGPVSREGYRILQESLTNVVRHAGAVPTRVRVAVADGVLTLEVRNPLPDVRASPARGSGLRGIRERAALLGGRAHTGPEGGDWRVRVELPPG
ncbi:histidine kinase [Streptomyces parvulus]|uniref:sensor histidine kinase n=1 Tax=Streptomyces parvulus TaxID=146923 RepID=UPI00345469D7